MKITASILQKLALANLGAVALAGTAADAAASPERLAGAPPRKGESSVAKPKTTPPPATPRPRPSGDPCPPCGLG